MLGIRVAILITFDVQALARLFLATPIGRNEGSGLRGSGIGFEWNSVSTVLSVPVRRAPAVLDHFDHGSTCGRLGVDKRRLQRQTMGICCGNQGAGAGSLFEFLVVYHLWCPTVRRVPYVGALSILGEPGEYDLGIPVVAGGGNWVVLKFQAPCGDRNDAVRAGGFHDARFASDVFAESHRGKHPCAGAGAQEARDAFRVFGGLIVDASICANAGHDDIGTSFERPRDRNLDELWSNAGIRWGLSIYLGDHQFDAFGATVLALSIVLPTTHRRSHLASVPIRISFGMIVHQRDCVRHPRVDCDSCIQSAVNDADPHAAASSIGRHRVPQSRRRSIVSLCSRSASWAGATGRESLSRPQGRFQQPARQRMESVRVEDHSSGRQRQHGVARQKGTKSCVSIADRNKSQQKRGD